MTDAEQKQHLREAIKSRIIEMTDAERSSENRSICTKLLDLIPKQSTICAYSALETEVDLTELITILISSECQVFLPRYADDSITFHHIQNLDELEEGAFSVLEPPANLKIADPLEIDIVLVPGRAFDTQGNRLGKGKGGYDKWIEDQRKANPKTKMWGISFKCQMINDVPTEEHDQSMDDVIITY